MGHNTPARMRTVRCVATGKVTTQSSNKTKRLLKLGGYVEVFPGLDGAKSQWEILGEMEGRSRMWRRIGIGAGTAFAVAAVLVWLRALYLI